MANRDIIEMMGSGLLNPPSPDNLWGQEGAEFAGLTDAQKREYFNWLDASKLEQQRRAEMGGGPLAREVGLGATAGAAGGAMSGMLNPPAETFSEMMIEEKGPMPDEFGNMTPVPSSDEEAVKQDFRRVLADGTIGQLQQYIEMNIGDLRFLAQTDNSIAKDLEAALRFISTGDQSRFQGPSPDQNLRTWGDVLGEDQNIAQKTFQPPPASGAAFASPGGWDPYAYMEQSAAAGELTPDMLPREGGQPFQTAPEFAHGGYVRGRGRGRGTMPGELQRKGSLSVRVAGESMGEYDKRRGDEDDVRPVRRTLDTALSPTLSRRIFG
jgi:hypothetical protein